jgi:hypothetical protein
MDDAAATYRLAFEQGVRVLAEQQTLIDGLRTRAGILMSIVTSFLGPPAIASGPSLVSWLAIAMFAVFSASVVAIVWPHSAPDEAIRPVPLVQIADGDDAIPLHRVHRNLALHLDRGFVVNRNYIARLAGLMRTASVFLVIEVAAWVADLVVRT